MSDIEFGLIPPPRNNEAIVIKIDGKTVPITEVQSLYNTLKVIYPGSSIIAMPKEISFEYFNKSQILGLQEQLTELLKNIPEDGQI